MNKPCEKETDHAWVSTKDGQHEKCMWCFSVRRKPEDEQHQDVLRMPNYADD